jgi:hypothetical protein
MVRKEASLFFNELRNFEGHHKFSPRKQPLTKNELEKISQYLKNPTTIGVWTLKANSVIKDGICQTITSQITEKIGDKKSTEIRSLVKNVKINFDKNDMEIVFSNIDRFSLVFSIFDLLKKMEKNSESFSEYLSSNSPYESVIFQLIDLEKIKSDYLEAYTFFKDNIYFENFIPSIYGNEIFRIKNGYLILFKNSEQDEIDNEIEDDEHSFGHSEVVMLSLDYQPLETMMAFLKILNRINGETIYPVFSPEEEVFAPYFVFLKPTYRSIIHKPNIRQKIAKSIEEYDESQNHQCINTIGLVFEEYLTEIYETCFRETCPKEKTLGELLDIIEKRTNEQFQEPPIVKPDPRPLQKKLNNLSPTLSDSEKVLELVTIIREMMIHTNTSSQYLESKISLVEKKPRGKTIFPRELRRNIDELIRNRNAVSHKTQVPIGNYEALRSIYCFITVVVWLNEVKNTVDWKQNKDQILLFLINKYS